MQPLDYQPLKNCKRAVLKLGTNILRADDGSVDESRMGSVGRIVASLRERGVEIVIVSSGAIGLGMGKLGLKRRPTKLPELQACAAIGQTILMETWQRSFAPHGLTVAQVLLTREDVRGRKRHLAVHDTMEKLLTLGTIPIVNENDTVSADEIKFGDNDILSALVASLIKAELLVILSTAPGLVDREGTGEIVRVVEEITPEIRAMAGGSETATSVGGMITKIDAAQLATTSGCGVFIGSGYRPEILDEIFEGNADGTFFVPQKRGLQSKKRWIAFFERPQGTLMVDEGARSAVVADGSSLLPRGITGFEGDFRKGAIVNIRQNGETFARGVSTYSSDELKAVIGRGTSELKTTFPDRKHFEAVHRDSLVLLA